MVFAWHMFLLGGEELPRLLQQVVEVDVGQGPPQLEVHFVPFPPPQLLPEVALGFCPPPQVDVEMPLGFVPQLRFSLRFPLCFVHLSGWLRCLFGGHWGCSNKCPLGFLLRLFLLGLVGGC